MSSSLAAELCRIVAPEKLPDRLLASGVIRPSATASLSEQPVLAYVFEVAKPWLPSSQLLPALVTTLEEGYTNLESKGNLDDQFENLLREVNQKLNEISESGETDWIGSLNGLILLIGKHEIHFAQTGRCPAFLLQNNRIRQITDEAGTTEGDVHPLKTFSNLASGKLGENDQILIANQELYNEISLDALRRILNTSSPYQSSVQISKELKKEKNSKICSLIIALRSTNALGSEPEVVSLEEALQSNIKKVQGKLGPLLERAKSGAKKFSEVSAKAAVVVGEKAKKAAEQASHKAKDTFKTAEPTDTFIENSVPEEALEKPIVEDIVPRGAEPELVTESEIGTIIPASEFALEKSKSSHEKKTRHGVELVKYLVLKKIPYLAITALHHFILWLQVPKNKKIAALGLATLLITVVIWGAVAQRNPSTEATGNVNNATLITDVRALKTKIDTAIELQQDVEASRLVEQAMEKLMAVANPSGGQNSDVDALWESITLSGDKLSKTTRLTSATASYQFNGEVGNFITNLPYFYGIKKDTANVLRTGIGDLKEIQSSIPIPSKDDAVVSLAKSVESDTAGYILTKQSQVLRIAQIGTSTDVRPITPAAGEFAAGDVIASYSGNVYILDTKSGLVWRYGNSGTVYSEGKSLFDPNKINLKKSVSMAIDGSFYVLKQDGSVTKLTGGKADATFALKGQPTLSQKLIQPTLVVTNEGLSNLFILDAGSTSSERSTGRILEFTKNGDFVKQYAFPTSFTNVKSFDINTKDNKIWVLNGSTVSEFAI
jgi:serine/threonine protein phosphatase PrpC